MKIKEFADKFMDKDRWYYHCSVDGRIYNDKEMTIALMDLMDINNDHRIPITLMDYKITSGICDRCLPDYKRRNGLE